MLKVALLVRIDESEKCFADCRFETILPSTVQMGVAMSPRYQRIRDTSSSLLGGVMLHGRAMALPISALYAW